MYEGMTGRVSVGHWLSEKFSVNIRSKQGGSLSPLQFIMGRELVSMRVSKRGILTKNNVRYADDLAIVVESGQKL